MKESLRKPLLFLIIVVVGSVLVLFDIPLLILVPLLLIVGFATLLALGSITISEIREGIAGLGKTGILKRLNDIKFFEKKTADTKKVTPPPPGKKDPKKEIKKDSDAKPGLKAHISTFFSSIGSLGSILRQKSRQGKKVEEINKLLDKTVSEKVTTPPPASTASASMAGGGGTRSGKTSDMDDPFMSLSGDEFDEGLLEGLGEDDDMMGAPAAPGEEPAFNPADFPDLEDAGPDLPPPALDTSSAAGDILKAAGEDAGGGPEEFSGLDESDLSDADFGDLDNLSLDELGPDSDLGDTPDAAPAAPSAGTDTAAPATARAGDSNAVKTAWIPSDAPKDAGEAEDEVGTQADMAAFASGSSGDEDMLSSLASDVKHVKKEENLSLLRELKDFRAPATEIESELSGVFQRMSVPQPTRKKDPQATKRIK
jgi:hypothetical protein